MRNVEFLGPLFTTVVGTAEYQNKTYRFLFTCSSQLNVQILLFNANQIKTLAILNQNSNQSLPILNTVSSLLNVNMELYTNIIHIIYRWCECSTSGQKPHNNITRTSQPWWNTIPSCHIIKSNQWISSLRHVYARED